MCHVWHGSRTSRTAYSDTVAVGSFALLRLGMQDWSMALQQRNLTLPEEVVEYMEILGHDDRNVYLQALRGRGWTLQSLATAVGVSRERVRQIIAAEWPVGVLEDGAPLPSPPERVERVRTPREVVMPTPETLARLLELQPLARRVVGNSPKYRAEADEYVRLLHHAHTVEGVSYYRLAKLLKVEHGAIRSRLVRYGYIEPGVDSGTRSYRRIKKENRV